MLPLWLTFLTLSLVAAFGSIFFFQEAISLSDSLTPILFFSSLQRFVEFLVSHASSYIIGKLRRDRYKKQMMELMRIGIGLSCCVLCCIVAWVAAVERMLHEDEESLMSVYLLTPQYGPPFWEFMMGVGKFACMLCILIFSLIGWFDWKLTDSRFEWYYIFLMVLSFANVVLYWVVAVWYGGDIFLVGEGEETESSDQTYESTGEGHHISHQSHVRRTVSVPEGISSSEDAKKERPERPLLTSVSTNTRRSFSIA